MNTSDNPYESPHSPNEALDDAERIRRRLTPVAIGLQVSSILHIAGGLFYFVFVYSQVTAPDADPEASRMSIIYCMYFAIPMTYSALLITGAFSMIRLGSYTWAFTVCILAMVPMLGPCYFLAVPFGVWGLFILKRQDVREAFGKP